MGQKQETLIMPAPGGPGLSASSFAIFRGPEEGLGEGKKNTGGEGELLCAKKNKKPFTYILSPGDALPSRPHLCGKA